LGFDNPLLDGGKQNLALDERQREIFGAISVFAARASTFADTAG